MAMNKNKVWLMALAAGALRVAFAVRETKGRALEGIA